MTCSVLQSFATASAVSARSLSWIITFGAASPTMKCSSGTVRRVLSGTSTAPSRPQANCTSSVSVVFSASTATRSPRCDLEVVAQMRGEARYPRVEFAIGEAALAGEIDRARACPAYAGRNARSSRNNGRPRLSPCRRSLPPVVVAPCPKRATAASRVSAWADAVQGRPATVLRRGAGGGPFAHTAEQVACQPLDASWTFALRPW